MVRKLVILSWVVLALSFLSSSRPYTRIKERVQLSMPLSPERHVERRFVPQTKQAILATIARDVGIPPELLWGIWTQESTRGRNTKHINPTDKGEFGLHESPAIHAERAKKWGEYDALVFEQAAFIAAHVLLENYQLLGDMRLAVGAYNAGRNGIKLKGLPIAYVENVHRYARESPYVRSDLI